MGTKGSGASGLFRCKHILVPRFSCMSTGSESEPVNRLRRLGGRSRPARGLEAPSFGVRSLR